MSPTIVARYLSALDKAAPAKVDEYFKKVKKDNPDYSDSQAWATAWSIYCRANGSSEHCHQDEYLTGK